MSTIEQRLQHLEDIEAIRQLKHYFYCDRVDRGIGLGDRSALDEVISRFASDIIADFTGFPVAVGIEAVSSFYTQTVPSLLTWSQHRVMNELIDVRGDTATGQWYIDCPVVFRDGNPLNLTGSGIIAGRYHERYRKENGVWKWTAITANLDVIAPWDRNWIEARYVAENPNF